MARRTIINIAPSKPITLNTRHMLLIVLNDKNLTAIPINYESTLEELRIQLVQRLIPIESKNQFICKGFLIAPVDENKFCINEIVENNVVAMQSRPKISTPQSPNLDIAQLSWGLKPTSKTTHNHQGLSSTSYQLDRLMWKTIYAHTSLLRGRCFLLSGPQIGDFPVIRLKPNWQPNSFPFDDARVHIEMSQQQMTNEYLNGKFYNLNAIINLPFVHITFGGTQDRNRSRTNNVEKMQAFTYHKVPRVIHIFDETMIEAEPMFVDEIDDILNDFHSEEQYEQLCRVFNKFGHGYAAKVVLGGYQIRVQHQEINETSDKDEREQKIKANVNVTNTEVGGGIGFEHNRKQGRTRKDMNGSLYMDCSTTGGNSLQTDVDEWREGLKDPNTWRIIEYQRIEPVYRLLDFERQRQIEMILAEHEQIEQSRKRRSRHVSDELVFDFNEGFYIYNTQIEKHLNNYHSLPSTKKNEMLLLFYSPTFDQWFWTYKEQKQAPWTFVKYTEINDLKIKSTYNIIDTLKETNPIPNDDITEICSKFENLYVPDGTLAFLCKSVNHIFKTHRFP